MTKALNKRKQLYEERAAEGYIQHHQVPVVVPGATQSQKSLSSSKKKTSTSAPAQVVDFWKDVEDRVGKSQASNYSRGYDWTVTRT